MESLETNEKTLLKKQYKDIRTEMEVLEDGEKKQEYENQMKEILGKLNVIKSQRNEKKLLKEKKTKLAKKNPNLPKKGTAFNKEQHE